jgi:hypothetical protein
MAGEDRSTAARKSAAHAKKAGEPLEAALKHDTPEETGRTEPVVHEPPETSGLPKGASMAAPVYDPVDEYPERPYEEAIGDTLHVVHHDEEKRDAALQLEQDPDTGAIRRMEGIEGPIVNSSYQETVVIKDGEVRGYFPPVYEDAEG